MVSFLIFCKVVPDDILSRTCLQIHLCNTFSVPKDTNLNLSEVNNVKGLQHKFPV